MSFIFKILTFIYAVISYFERKVLIKNIDKDDLVLDVGSGDKPFWRADVVVDKYLKDDQQRHAGSMLYDKRKVFIQADVENLPFKDKVFDFVFCSHLLEHVENPDKAMGELTRVAKKGYIEVPNATLELLQQFPPHLWYCSYLNNALTFKQKEKESNFFIDNVEAFGKHIFANNIFQYLLIKYVNQIFISFYWNDKVEFKVLRAKDKKNIYKYRMDKNESKSAYLKLSFFVYKVFYGIMVLLFYRKKNFKIKELMIYRSDIK